MVMVLDGLDWASRAIRICRAARDSGWWLCLSARQALLETVAEEATRLTAEFAALAPPTTGTLRQSIGRERP